MRSAARLRRARAPHLRRGFREGTGVDAYVQPQAVDANKPNRYSATLTAHARRGGAQAMLVPCGVDSEKLAQPQIGVASIWWEGNPGNMHLLDLSELVKTSLEQQFADRFNILCSQLQLMSHVAYPQQRGDAGGRAEGFQAQAEVWDMAN